MYNVPIQHCLFVVCLLLFIIKLEVARQLLANCFCVLKNPQHARTFHNVTFHYWHLALNIQKSFILIIVLRRFCLNIYNNNIRAGIWWWHTTESLVGFALESQKPELINFSETIFWLLLVNTKSFSLPP